LRRAEADPRPDLQLQVRPIYSAPERRPLVEVQVGGIMPLYHRNQGNIHAAQAELARTQAELERTRRRLVDRLALIHQRYSSARQQVEAYSRRILPNAEQSLKLIRIGYEKADTKYDFQAYLQAQRTLLQAQLAHVQALGELAKAAAEMDGLLQSCQR
jgi:cobalt-zinc-cadmium efflux system outer membrane protein